MKKRITVLLIALFLLFSMTACSGESNPEKAPATDAPVTEAPVLEEPVREAPAAEAPEDEEAAEPAEFPDVRYDIHFPILENVGNAVYAEDGMLDNGDFYIGYVNASKDDLELFVILCSYCGVYAIGGPQDDGAVTYYLARPGYDFIAIASLMPDSDRMVVEVPLESIGVGAAEIEVMMEYYLQDLEMPSGYGVNVMPQFYASIGRTSAEVDGLTSNIFNTEAESCWMEMYSEVNYPTLHKYLSDMMLCGFDVRYDKVDFDDNNVMNSVTFMLNNGNSRIAILYDAEGCTAMVFYEPGVDRYLLSGSEYIQYIPQP